MTPDDLEALRRQAHADQETAGVQHYHGCVEREIADSTADQLEQAQAAGLIADAAQERLIMLTLFMELGRSHIADHLDDELDNVVSLAERYLNGAPSARRQAAFEYHELQVRARSILHQAAIRSWMEALRVHGLLPATTNGAGLDSAPPATADAPRSEPQG